MLITELLKEQENFSDSEKTIAKYLLEKRDEIRNLSSRALCNENFTTTSALIRLCKKIGFKGYADFKEGFLKEIEYFNLYFDNIDVNKPFCQDENIMKISAIMSTLYQESARDTLSLIEQDSLMEAVNILYTSKIIYVISTGIGLWAGESFKEKMLKIGRAVYVSNNFDFQYYQCCNARKEDSYIVISYSGQNGKICQFVNELKKKNARIIGITSLGNNYLANRSNAFLRMTTREKLYSNVSNYTSTNSTMLIMDILYSCLFSRDFEKNLEHKLKISKQFERVRNSSNEIMKEDGCLYKIVDTTPQRGR